MKTVELLSPAGTLEKLKIALDFGADAVYGGVSHFSLRIRSGKEFSMEEFKDGIEYAHSKGKKVYATINGFPFNSQISLLKKHIVAMAELKPDAFIVATPGVLKLAKEIAPNMPLHLSTQANVMNVLDAKVYDTLLSSELISTLISFVSLLSVVCSMLVALALILAMILSLVRSKSIAISLKDSLRIGSLYRSKRW